MLGFIVHWDHKPRMNQDWLRYSFQLYDYPARAYSVDELVFVDPNRTLDVLNPPNKVVTTLSEAMLLFSDDIPAFFLHPNASSSLFDFTHPQDAVYVVGPDYDDFSVDYGNSLRVPVVDENLELWASQVVAITLAHRCNQWR
jgi:hypothetical protein